jgi:hypothetical protein
MQTSPEDANTRSADSNSSEALVRRQVAGALTWRGPALMLFARAAKALTSSSWSVSRARALPATCCSAWCSSP